MYKFIDSSIEITSNYEYKGMLEKVNYIIEESDTEQIQRQILQAIEDSTDLPSNPLTISLIEPVSEEQVELSINPFNYLTEDDCRNYLSVFRRHS